MLHVFNEIKTRTFWGSNEIEENKGVGCFAAASCIHCCNESSLIWFYDSAWSCILFFSLRANRDVLLPLCQKNCFGQLGCQHSVCSFREVAYQFGKSNHCLYVSFDHWWTDLVLNSSIVSLCFARGELEYSVGSAQKLHRIILLYSPSNPSQTQFNHILRKTSIFIHGSNAWAPQSLTKSWFRNFRWTWVSAPQILHRGRDSVLKPTHEDGGSGSRGFKPWGLTSFKMHFKSVVVRGSETETTRFQSLMKMMSYSVKFRTTPSLRSAHPLGTVKMNLK